MILLLFTILVYIMCTGVIDSKQIYIKLFCPTEYLLFRDKLCGDILHRSYSKVS